MEKRIIIYILLSIFLLTTVNAECTVTLDKAEYRPTETVTATMSCSAGNEKGQAYTLTWNNSTATVETDTGTTPLTAGNSFFETYVIPSGVNWIGATATLTGTNLEGSDTFNVTGNSSNILTINDAKFSPIALISQLFAIDFEVRDSAGDLVSGANCVLFGTDQQEAPLQTCSGGTTYAGRSVCGDTLDNYAFIEGQNYIAKVRCNCGIGDNACFDEDGVTIEKRFGQNSFPFTISSWLKTNTITDNTSYVMGTHTEVRVCANVTNYRDYRLPLEIYYAYRCDGTDNQSTDRILVDTHTEKRGINANTTQTQCARLEIINYPSLQNHVSICYASTDVIVLSNDDVTHLIDYPSTSASFNITSNSNILLGEGDNMLGLAAIIIFVLAFYLVMAINWNFVLFDVQNKEENKNNAIKGGLIWLLAWLIPLIVQFSIELGEVVGASADMLTLLESLYTTTIWIGYTITVYFMIYFGYNVLLYLGNITKGGKHS